MNTYIARCLCVSVVCLHSGEPFNCDNILRIVRGVKDWWSEGDNRCRGGGLGYWLAVSPVIIDRIRNNYVDPEVQQQKLIETWMQLDVFPSWHRLSRAVQRVGETQLASAMTTYELPPPGMCIPRWPPYGLVI